MIFRRETENTTGSREVLQIFNCCTYFITIITDLGDGRSKDSDGIIGMATKGGSRLVKPELIIFLICHEHCFLWIIIGKRTCNKKTSCREDNSFSSSTGSFYVFNISKTVALKKWHIPAGLTHVFRNDGLSRNDGPVNNSLYIFVSFNFGNNR